MPDPTLASALLALREHLGFFHAVNIVIEAVEQAGDIAAVVRELEQERDLLALAPRSWAPDPSRAPRAGDSLLRPPTGEATGRFLLAPSPVYRPTPFPDQRGRPLIRER